MARQTLMYLLFIAFCLQSTRAIQFLWGNSTAYDALCPAEGYASVPLPEEECNLRRYIMCSNGQAVAINDCPLPLRFNIVTGWCDQPENVPTPITCEPERVDLPIPETCVNGAEYVPVQGSCKKYIWCLSNGPETEMVCPHLSYYVHEKQRCLYITEPYVREIPADFLADCYATDPYIPDTAAPATSTTLFPPSPPAVRAVLPGAITDISTVPTDVTTAPADVPALSTDAPTTLTEAPTAPTDATVDTPIATPDTSTATPDTSTATPDASTAASDVFTAAPDASVDALDASTAVPDASTAASDALTAVPDASTDALDASTAVPDVSTAVPGASTAASDAFTAAPDASTDAPDLPTDTPEASTYAADASTAAPSEPTTAPSVEPPAFLF